MMVVLMEFIMVRFILNYFEWVLLIGWYLLWFYVYFLYFFYVNLKVF